jgi:hypothetical protein
MITVSYILFFVLSAPLPPKSGCGFEKSPASLSLVNNLVSNRYVYPVSHTEVGTKHPLLLCEVASLRSTSIQALRLYERALVCPTRGLGLNVVARALSPKENELDCHILGAKLLLSVPLPWHIFVSRVLWGLYASERPDGSHVAIWDRGRDGALACVSPPCKPAMRTSRTRLSGRWFDPARTGVRCEGPLQD